MIQTTLAPGVGWPSAPIVQAAPGRRFKRRKLTDAQADEARALKNSGLSTDQLCRHYRVSLDTIRDALRRQGAYAVGYTTKAPT